MDASPLSPEQAPILATGRSLDQQVDASSPNHSNYSNLTNSSSSSGSSASSPSACSSSSSSSSAPQYSADIRAAALHPQQQQPQQSLRSQQQRGSASGSGSGSGSAKTCELDLGEERDTFSPVSSPDCNGAAAVDVLPSSSGSLDNKIYEGGSKVKPPSKEEKQRQNEEIVCMETSTVSTETGSWESMYPAASVAPPEEPEEAEETPSVFKGISASSLLRDLEKRDQPLSTSGTSACFIDASSLRDEDEVLSFPSLDGHAQEEEVGQEVNGEEEEGEPSPTQQLEQFHKSFARCKGVRSVQQQPEQQDPPDEPEVEVDRPAAMSVPYSFQHNAQHFSVHPLGSSPKFSHHQQQQHHHPDLSYTTDYSSSSPAPSLVWSEQGRTHQQGGGASSSTPHNSMVHIEPASAGSNNSSIHRDYTLSSSLSHHRDSGAYCSDATDSPLPLPRTPKRSSKFDEANPIVSGGASIEDFREKQCESPSIKRRTDTCPIVSGGFVSLDFAPTRPLADEDDDEDLNEDAEIAGVEMRVKSGLLQRKPVPGIASWVVDMSDCRPERRRSTSSTTSSFRERSDSNSSHKSGCGFYVSLDDMDRKPAQEQPKAAAVAPPSQLSKSYTAPKSAGFFVDLSQSGKAEEQAPKDQELAVAKEEAKPEPKNIFSMFIDFGEQKAPRSNGRKEPLSLAQRLSSSLSSSASRRGGDTEVMKSSASSTETLMAKSVNQKDLSAGTGESKSLDYRCNLEPPLTVAALRRLSQQHRQQSDPAKRHSWGSNGQPEQASGSAAGTGAAGNDCKRSISLTANGATDSAGAGLMSIIDKLPIISKASSLSIDSSVSPYDDFSGSNPGLSSCSEEEQQGLAQGRIKKRRRDAQLNETYDKSSLASVTEGILSKDLSPASNTDTDDLTFQQDEQLAKEQAELIAAVPLQLSSSSNRTSSVMETIIEAKETASPKKQVTLNNGHTMESLHATIEKQKQLLETVNEHGEQTAQQPSTIPSSFVKLSDMDKPVKHDLQSPDSMSKSVGNNHRSSQLGQRLYRDENRARPHSWAMTRSTGNTLQNFTNSVDNIRSLSRLFPNFSKEFSNSLPNGMTLEQVQGQQVDYIQTDLSADSSLASSFSRSGMDESSLSCRQPRRLGEDLLKMFLQEIATDMLVEVHGRRIRAHKCILRSRCQYFAAMLAGHGSQSVVSLQGYSYAAVHFALCHIYSGASHPPDGISLMELAALADLLGLEGLKEVTSHALKTNYCHNFHKPCSGCTDGILQVLPVALNHALDDLYRKCLRWTCRHYLKVWPTRQFAQLPPDILGRCRQQIVAYLTSETVLDTVLDCDHLLAQLSAYRWGHVCEQLVREILEAAYAYVGDHFASLIASDSFLSLGHDRSRHIPRLETLLLHTAAELTPEQACRSYQRVTRLNTVLQAKVIHMPASLGQSELARELQGLQEEQLDWQPEYIRLVGALVYAVEQCLIRQCSRAMRVTAWQRMDLELRKKIQTLARLTEPLDMKRQNGKPVSKAFSFGGSTRSQDLVQIKLAIQAQTKRAHAQETLLYKATQTQDAGGVGHVQTTERGVQANHESREGGSKLLKSNSRAYVPHRASSQVTSERNSLNLHRRTQSEAPPVTHKKPAAVAQAASAVEPKTAQGKPSTVAAKLGEVRPRYLEPRKPRAAAPSTTNGHGAGPVRSATSSSIPANGGRKAPAKNLHISSSDSSRNSSPAARRVQNGTRLGNKSSNLSMDSLASPARRAKSSSRGPQDRYSSDQNSLAESMKSSVITNKTISHESLSGSSKLARIQQLNGHGKAASPGKAKATQRGSTVGNKSTRQLKQQHNAMASNGSSPSSVHTTKSAASRLSSVSSTFSTRELFKQRSISVPAGGADGAPNKGRHSFLSAKSREILAKRAEKNKLQQQQQQQQKQTEAPGEERGSVQLRSSAGPLRSSSHSAVSSMLQQHNLRNSLPSSIPTRRPNTLHLKKTTALTNGVGGPTKTATNGLSNGSYKSAQAVKQKLDLLIDAQLESAVPKERVESKLERSSTFCKDSADLDISELQIVE
ncbi:uncharacterized protein LOC108028524 [Drosophila biarmipes]|uniref:uncharacterized protein LOC108028524 n=1 Tax=Drosophila biarmipes TaxID=125945 RepID=UPI0007E77F31|nr:uncharacterized protein LOC108028524 [Drosophila biarmipes]XP_043951234.1 uncharacterized protein LOC108028524 [Drosophila biarmipes]XP_043951235.1 uncharacterized protein LOC108028524 [Drosophila biarmipes]